MNLQRAQELADQYGTKAYGSYQELLADPQIEAVSVLTPNFTHAEITIAALKAGKHVLCEKPMAVTLQDCEAMVQTAEQTGKKLMIGQNQRLTPAKGQGAAVQRRDWGCDHFPDKLFPFRRG